MTNLNWKNIVSGTLKYVTIGVVGTAMYVASDKIVKTVEGGVKNEGR